MVYCLKNLARVVKKMCLINKKFLKGYKKK